MAAICSGATWAALAAFLLLVVGMWARGLLTCLAGIVFCYSTWISPAPRLITQPDIDLRTAAIDSGLEAPIPKIIHQTWKDDHIPERWREAYDSCRELHPDYRHMLWTDASAREFVAHAYPWFLPTYDAYPYVIQRADVIRYLVLDTYGGAYVDLDVGCRRRLDDLRAFGAVLPLTRPLGYSNEFMMAAPGHPFVARLVARLRLWARGFGSKYPTVMFSTGPMFVTAQQALYATAGADAPDCSGVSGGEGAVDAAAGLPPPRSRREGPAGQQDDDADGSERRLHAADAAAAALRPCAGEVWALPDALYGKYSNGTSAYLCHYSGSSWHGGDAALVFWLQRHLSLLLWAGGGVALLLLTGVVWGGLLRRRRRGNNAGGGFILASGSGSGDWAAAVGNDGGGKGASNGTGNGNSGGNGNGNSGGNGNSNTSPRTSGLFGRRSASNVRFKVSEE